MKRFIPATFLFAAAGGCATPPPEPAVVPDVDRQVRRPAHAEDSVIEVSPLASGDVAVLIERARRAEAVGDLAEARDWLLQAGELAPRDPQVWQHLAEVELESGAYEAAIEHAVHSFNVGPRIGSLCSRNWLTIALAQEALDNNSLAEAANARAEACPVRARERL